jgi:two-component sensor histidine kinase/putative methionine-R-sulfoxide reductase with GAF domain
VSDDGPSEPSWQSTIALSDLRWLAQVAALVGEARTLEELALRCESVLKRYADVERDGLYVADFRESPPVLRLFYARGFTPEERDAAERTALDRHPGWVVKTGETLWVPDTRAVEPSSPSRDSPRAVEMRSRLWIPISKDGEVFGALGFASSRPNAFDEQHREVLKFVAELVGIAYPRLRAEYAASQDRRERVAAMEALARSLTEKETLLKEIHHRVKNNLQIVSSLLMLQSEKMPSDEARAMLQESVFRVRSMALIHQQLYGVDSLSRVDLAGYARTLSDSLRGVLAPSATVQVRAEPIEVTVETAVPLGLVLNELITNAFKYGLTSSPRASGGDAAPEPDVLVELSACDGVLNIVVQDRGPGLPSGFDLTRATSLGLHLVHALTRQLRARLTIGGPGARFALVCPLPSS